MSDFELNVEKGENEFEEVEWIDHRLKVKEVGDQMTFRFDRIHISDKAVSAFLGDLQGVSFFTVSDYEGETLGVRFLVACAKALELDGKVNASEVMTGLNDGGEWQLILTMKGWKTDEGESRTYKSIRVVPVTSTVN